ncbi:SUMO-activating enzyme subunit 1 [Chamberlinius hualienensis]
MKRKSGEVEDQVVTEDEAALYDRQIRLWGLPAQKRLRGSRVLIVGISGLGAEVCKNIVLAGIKSLTILDHNQVDTVDLCSQFFVSKSDVGVNRATCSLSKIQQLNSTVDVVADTDNVIDKSDEFFTQFDIICLTNCLVDVAVRINEICRKNSIKFIFGEVYGVFGYAFMDFGEHEYQEEQMSSGTHNSSIMISEFSQKKMSYISLKQALSVERTVSANKRSSRLTNSYYIMKAIHEFESECGRRPKREDADQLKEIFQQRLLSDYKEELARYCMAELSPVCAIVGGVYAQEVIKALSCQDSTYNNFFFYNGMNGTGVVELHGVK